MSVELFVSWIAVKFRVFVSDDDDESDVVRGGTRNVE